MIRPGIHEMIDCTEACWAGGAERVTTEVVNDRRLKRGVTDFFDK